MRRRRGAAAFAGRPGWEGSEPAWKGTPWAGPRRRTPYANRQSFSGSAVGEHRSWTHAFGLDTFGDVTVDGAGDPVAPAQVIRDIVAQGELADQVGIDHFSIGEHHRPDFAVSAPDMVLAGLAARTERITLGTAVIVLSSDDPLRVVERFSTLDLEGREAHRGRAPCRVARSASRCGLRDPLRGEADLLAALAGEPITNRHPRAAKDNRCTLAGRGCPPGSPSAGRTR